MNIPQDSFGGPAVLPAKKLPSTIFNEQQVLHDLKHYLPAQAPLKDFIHHNTLHAFQHLKFYPALRRVYSVTKVSLSFAEFRELYQQKRIRTEVFHQVITARKGPDLIAEWQEKLLNGNYRAAPSPRIGALRAHWKRLYKIDLDSLVHPTLFRVLCSYLDQGIAIWRFPVWKLGFLDSVREMERHSFTSFSKPTGSGDYCFRVRETSRNC